MASTSPGSTMMRTLNQQVHCASGLNMAQAAPPTHTATQYAVANHTSTTKSCGGIISRQNLQRGFAGPREPNVPMTPRSAGRASDPPTTPTPAAPLTPRRAIVMGLHDPNMRLGGPPGHPRLHRSSAHKMYQRNVPIGSAVPTVAASSA